MSKTAKIITYIFAIVQWVAGLAVLIASELVKVHGQQGSITVLVAGIIITVGGAITSTAPKLLEKIKELW